MPGASTALSSASTHEPTAAACVAAADPDLIATEARNVRIVVDSFGVEILANIHPAHLARAKANITSVLNAYRALRDVHLPASARILNTAGGLLPQMSKNSGSNSAALLIFFFLSRLTTNACHMHACICLRTCFSHMHLDCSLSL
jgi:hypothetical protein